MIIRHPERPYDNDLLPTHKVENVRVSGVEQSISFFLSNDEEVIWDFDDQSVFESFIDAYAVEIISEKKIFQDMQGMLASMTQRGVPESPFN